MQVAEVAGVMEGQDAPAAVLFPSVRTGCSGEDDLHLFRDIAFTNDVRVRRDEDTTLYSLEEDVEILGLNAQAFESQAKGRVHPRIKSANASLLKTSIHTDNSSHN